MKEQHWDWNSDHQTVDTMVDLTVDLTAEMMARTRVPQKADPSAGQMVDHSAGPTAASTADLKEGSTGVLRDSQMVEQMVDLTADPMEEKTVQTTVDHSEHH